ncbi:MAG: TlpA family protein disulfide reductase [Roseburia sp.]|nr:TlpA family protein disulfide reductase [Roseburia sp.]MCM1280054.1 TlpA family protein disulfide reductase [Robinsoniella sp.]
MKKTKNKKKTICIIFAIAIILLTGCGSSSEKNSPENSNQENSNQENSNPEKSTQKEVYQELSTGDVAPDFTVETVSGNDFTLSEQNGKVVLLNFWATWCGPCVEEMPAFERLYGEYGEEVAILAVNCMEDTISVAQFLADKGYTFPIAYDPEGAVNMKYPTDGIPYTLVIGKDGMVKNIYLGARGADAQYEEYKSAIDEALKE